VRHLRLSLSRELINERKELHGDLLRIAKEMQVDRKGNKIDLSASTSRKKQELLEKEIKHLEDDLKKDLDRE
jgi:hypothetical protein